MRTFMWCDGKSVQKKISLIVDIDGSQMVGRRSGRLVSTMSDHHNHYYRKSLGLTAEYINRMRIVLFFGCETKGPRLEVVLHSSSYLKHTYLNFR